MTVRPLFVLSLPRSGSTLLQKIVATSPDVATASEPWLLLPQLYALRPHGAQAEYGHRTAARALADFADGLPGGRPAYLDEVARMALATYERAAAGAPWFLDKTPRYHLIVDDLFTLFPDARFVFLWRHPLAVAASMIESFGGGRWNLDRYSSDLHGGLVRLVDAWSRADPRAVAVRYEDLVSRPDETAQRLFEFVGVAPGAPDAFASVGLRGRMGDRTGITAYATVERASLDRWQRTMRNPLRRRWCAGYLRFVGEERLAHMGYDLAAVQRELAEIPPSPRGLVSDAARRIHGRSGRTSPWNLRGGAARPGRAGLHGG